jgi:hypothetical protein
MSWLHITRRLTMKRICLGLMVILLASAIHSQSWAAWWLEKEAGGKRIEISDKKLPFHAGVIKCVVSGTVFSRMQDDTVAEHRNLTCWVSKDTSVTVQANCEYPRNALTILKISKSGKVYKPALICGKNK